MADDMKTKCTSVVLKRPPIRIHLFSSQQSLVDWAINEPVTHYQGVLIAMNAEKLLLLYRNPGLFDKCIDPIFYPDGVGILMLTKYRPKVKIPGAELWLRILHSAHQRHLSVGVLGATPEISSLADQMIRARYPDLKLISHDGFQENEDYFNYIIKDKPDVIFVAMGSPKQEILISHLQHIHSKALYLGIGGSLDVFTKAKKRAPKIIQNLNMEFAYRLIKEPFRIGRQIALIRFAVLAAMGIFGGKIEK